DRSLRAIRPAVALALRLAAVAAELGAGGHLGAAARAERLLQAAAHGLAAAAAELLARPDPRLAVRARGEHLGRRIDAGDLIDVAHLLGELLRGDVGLVMGGFLGE